MSIDFFPKVVKQKRLSPSQKAAIILSVNGKCSGCGKKFDGDILDIHHIKRISDGGSNSPNNLAVLCPTCHRKAHSGQLKDLKGIGKKKLSPDVKKRLKKTRKVERFDGIEINLGEKDLKKMGKRLKSIFE